ncbi:MAG: hypothetical protein EBX02_10385, partial [Betaproteobacteria bacterium]|nr:hypothetical protein [Betaproteobacteria bacterium]
MMPAHGLGLPADFTDVFQRQTRTCTEPRRSCKQPASHPPLSIKLNNFDITQARGGTYYVPLKFCYNTNPGQYLPLVALSYHDVKLNFDIDNYLNC